MTILCSWLNWYMKIRQTKSNAVIVEFDEFLNMTEQMVCISFGVDTQKNVDDIIDRMNDLSSRRIAYNMWEFASREDADHALFMLGLKL